MTLRLKTYRLRAINLLRDKLEYADNTLDYYDYLLDDLVRKTHKLSGRPVESLPYIGWITDDQTEVSLSNIS